jgi:hypothetical protein
MLNSINLEYLAHLRLVQDAYRNSLYHTANRLLGYKEMTEATHGPIVRALEADTKRKLIVVPRGCFKSSLCSIAYPVWLLMQNPNLRILIDSELFENSVSFLTEIKNHLLSPKFVDLFGDWTPTVEQQKKLGYSWGASEITIRGRNKILKDPSIQVGGIGTTKVGRHVDVIIADDYNSPRNSATPEQRLKVTSHYQYNMSILEPNGTYVVVGTRYSEDDIIGFIIGKELGFKSLADFRKAVKDKSIIEPRGLI